jgi:hypothetical protein
MQLLDLQSSLQSEIQAKETIREELRNAKALQIVTEKLESWLILLSFLNCFCFSKLKEALVMNEEQVAEITRLQEELASAKASHLGSGCN